MTGSIRIDHVIVCDDARREDNGKYIIIGAYGDQMIVPSFPAQIPLCFWMEARATKIADIALDFKVVGNEDIDLIQGRLIVSVSDIEHTLLMPIKFPILLFQIPMKITLFTKQTESEWEVTKTIEMVRSPLPTLAPMASPAADTKAN